MAAQERITGVKVHQWLPEWKNVRFSSKDRRRKPEPHFYLFSLRASLLKSLAGISRRTTSGGLRRTEDIGIQRRHDSERSLEIGAFIRYGYPWSKLGINQRSSGEFQDLQKPGWLPTAIVVNILRQDDERRGKKVASEDLVKVKASADHLVEIELPAGAGKETWGPAALHPIEVIDGQHRLWAFEGGTDEDFELPVVAFCGLDISWQAYLFWTINITPKHINPSLAFDLYPLLRTEDWLEKFEGPKIYRETRAQELTESLWAHPRSPWHNRINMLGEPGQKGVTQAAWIRALLNTYIKAWEGKRVSIGGVFGAPIGQHQTVLPWSRAQQAAFLIFVWDNLRAHIQGSHAAWAEALRKGNQAGLADSSYDPAFAGAHTLLNTDQGIRGVLYVTNDLCFLQATELDLGDWVEEEAEPAPTDESISMAMRSLEHTKVAAFLSGVNRCLASFDWRTSSAPGLTEVEKLMKSALRGSGGYKELRKQLLQALAKGQGKPASIATKALKILKYD